jgi:hypothetical protein
MSADRARAGWVGGMVWYVGGIAIGVVLIIAIVAVAMRRGRGISAHDYSSPTRSRRKGHPGASRSNKSGKRSKSKH